MASRLADFHVGHAGSLASFASHSIHAPWQSLSSQRDESYNLLLELCSQEPTIQSCFKIIESTCLARGVDMEIRGKPPSESFRMFIARYYLPFAESAIRYFFALGFVPWRLRKISTGDVVPEVIPLGIFTWSIESITNRNARRGNSNRSAGGPGSSSGAVARTEDKNAKDVHQIAAEKAFQKQKAYFSDPKRVPYPLQGDVMRMETRRDSTKQGQNERLKGFSATATQHQNGGGTNHDKGPSSGGADPRINANEKRRTQKKKRRRGQQQGRSNSSSADEDSYQDDDDDNSDDNRRKRVLSILNENTPAFYRQRFALQRQQVPPDDEETKILRYCLHFTENCSVLEDDVEIYEYLAPTNSITRFSVLYGTVPTPLSHLLIDYRNIRTTQIRQAYADSYNTQASAKLICSYNAAKNMYNISEGNPILNAEGWGPQQRLGLNTDTNLPSEIEANAYTRDAVAENLMKSKHVEHKPVIYTLPKNTTLESQQKLESIIDVSALQGKFAKDISSLLGVPFEMVSGGYSDDTSGKSRSMHNTKVFITNMMSICRHIELLLTDVYLSAYGGSHEDVKFIVRPTPRIEVNSVEEICQLLEAGVVSFDNAMHLSNMILGVDLQQGIGAKANAGQFSRAFVTPSNKKDLIVAENAQKKAASSSK